jgi:hypothetical protein
VLYLPPGGWIDWHDGALYRGPRRLRVAAPLERIPLFARAGSVMPTRSATLHDGESPAEPCVFEVFPGGDFQQSFYEDDGETTAYRDGAFALTPLRLWSHAGGRLRFEIGAREGDLVVPERPLRVVVHACPPRRGVRGRRAPGATPCGWSAAASRCACAIAARVPPSSWLPRRRRSDRPAAPTPSSGCGAARTRACSATSGQRSSGAVARPTPTRACVAIRRCRCARARRTRGRAELASPLDRGAVRRPAVRQRPLIARKKLEEL